MNTSTNILVRSIYGRFNLNSLLALAGIVGPLVLIFTDIVVAISDPGYSYIRHSISSLAWAPLGWVQTIGFLTIGLLLELFVAGLFFNIRGTRGFGIGIGLLSLFGFGLLLVGAFHTDPAVGPHTVDGTIHGIVAKTIFWLFPFASLSIAPSFKKHAYFKRYYLYSIVAAVIALVMMLGSLWLPEDVSWFGLFERVLVADEVLWVVVIAIRLMRLSLER